MLTKVKKRCGIAETVKVYDEEIESLITDCAEDMKASGVPPDLVEAGGDPVVTATTFYVKAHIGNDRSDTEKYQKLYEKKVFRLTLEGEE